MEKIPSRFKTLHRALGITYREIADRMGVSFPLVATYIAGTRTVPENRVEALCKEFGVNRLWWETGTGPIFEQGKEPKPKPKKERRDPDRIAKRAPSRRKYLGEVDAEGWTKRAEDFLSICPVEFKRDIYEILKEERS